MKTFFTENKWMEVSNNCDLQTQVGNMPLCLALLAQTNLVAAEGRDFSLKGDSENKFKCLRFPESFRTSVAQVTNELTLPTSLFLVGSF
jgi:hypothetical protein